MSIVSNAELNYIYIPVTQYPGIFGKKAPVAQLDRASDYGSEGWGFESLRAHIIVDT
jgi:hypothetical protein